MTEHTKRWRGIVIALIAGIGVVVAIALIAVFTRGAPVEYAADTPEGVVQRYSQAMVDGDYGTARDLVAPGAADTCDRPANTAVSVRVTLLETTERDDAATVRVRIASEYGSGPLGSSDYEYDGAFRLVRTDDGWGITAAPWELAVCSEIGAG